MPSTTPKAIRLNVRENLLTIEWDDGHVGTYDGGYLRYVCPCAGCRGHGPGDVPPPTWEQCKDVRVTNVAAVGGYAVHFDFSDAHGTGIYSFDWLRSHCPSVLEGVDERGRPKGA